MKSITGFVIVSCFVLIQCTGYPVPYSRHGSDHTRSGGTTRVKRDVDEMEIPEYSDEDEVQSLSTTWKPTEATGAVLFLAENSNTKMEAIPTEALVLPVPSIADGDKSRSDDATAPTTLSATISMEITTNTVPATLSEPLVNPATDKLYQKEGDTLMINELDTETKGDSVLKFERNLNATDKLTSVDDAKEIEATKTNADIDKPLLDEEEASESTPSELAKHHPITTVRTTSDARATSDVNIPDTFSHSDNDDVTPASRGTSVSGDDVSTTAIPSTSDSVGTSQSANDLITEDVAITATIETELTETTSSLNDIAPVEAIISNDVALHDTSSMPMTTASERIADDVTTATNLGTITHDINASVIDDVANVSTAEDVTMETDPADVVDVSTAEDVTTPTHSELSVSYDLLTPDGDTVRKAEPTSSRLPSVHKETTDTATVSDIDSVPDKDGDQRDVITLPNVADVSESSGEDTSDTSSVVSDISRTTDSIATLSNPNDVETSTTSVAIPEVISDHDDYDVDAGGATSAPSPKAPTTPINMTAVVLESTSVTAIDHQTTPIVTGYLTTTTSAVDYRHDIPTPATTTTVITDDYREITPVSTNLHTDEAIDTGLASTSSPAGGITLATNTGLVVTTANSIHRIAPEEDSEGWTTIQNTESDFNSEGINGTDKTISEVITPYEGVSTPNDGVTQETISEVITPHDSEVITPHDGVTQETISEVITPHDGVTQETISEVITPHDGVTQETISDSATVDSGRTDAMSSQTPKYTTDGDAVQPVQSRVSTEDTSSTVATVNDVDTSATAVTLSDVADTAAIRDVSSPTRGTNDVTTLTPGTSSGPSDVNELTVTDVTTGDNIDIIKDVTSAMVQVTTGTSDLTSDEQVLKLTSAIPDVIANLPDVTTNLPDVTTNLPDVTTNLPDVIANPPDVTTNFPDVITTLPDVTTNLSDITINLPDVITNLPDVKTTSPDVTTNFPDVKTSLPDVTTNLPDVTTNFPDVTTSHFGVTTTPPEVTTNVPNVKTDGPNVESSTPNVTTIDVGDGNTSYIDVTESSSTSTSIDENATYPAVVNVNTTTVNINVSSETISNLTGDVVTTPSLVNVTTPPFINVTTTPLNATNDGNAVETLDSNRTFLIATIGGSVVGLWLVLGPAICCVMRLRDRNKSRRGRTHSIDSDLQNNEFYLNENRRAMLRRQPLLAPAVNGFQTATAGGAGGAGGALIHDDDMTRISDGILKTDL